MKLSHRFKTLNNSTLLALTIALCAFVWIVSGVFFPSSKPQVTTKEREEKKLVSVRSEVSHAQDFINTIVVTGKTQAFRSSSLAAETVGRVVETPINEGQAVAKGEVILKVAEEDRRALLKQAQAALKKAEIEYNASRKLKEKQFNSEVQLATAKANLEAAKAAVEQAEIHLSNTQVTAPYDGLFETRHVEVGDYVKEGTVVADFVDLDPIKMTGFVTEKQITHLSVGAPAQVSLLDGRILIAHISYLASSANETTRTFAIELEANNEDMKVVEGLTAKIKLETQTYRAHKISPSILTLDDDGVVGVKTLDADNKVSFKPVEILSDKEEGMWVTGLGDKVRLITVGQEFVVDGQYVDSSGA